VLPVRYTFGLNYASGNSNLLGIHLHVFTHRFNMVTKFRLDRLKKQFLDPDQEMKNRIPYIFNYRSLQPTTTIHYVRLKGKPSVIRKMPSAPGTSSVYHTTRFIPVYVQTHSPAAQRETPGKFGLEAVCGIYHELIRVFRIKIRPVKGCFESKKLFPGAVIGKEQIHLSAVFNTARIRPEPVKNPF